MRRKSLILAVLGTCALVVLGAATGPASGKTAKTAAHRATSVATVTVTAGKPSELSFKLSKTSMLPAGAVTFKVTNLGLGFHNFKICTTPVASAAKNACVGKVTPLLKHGQSAKLVVVLTKTGKYEFMCAVSGHAAAGMKGLIGIGVTVTQPVSATSGSSSGSGSGSGSGSTGGTTTTTTTPASTTTTTTGGGVATGPDGCPAGQTIVSMNADDHDEDDAGAPSDGDGCV